MSAGQHVCPSVCMYCNVMSCSAVRCTCSPTSWGSHFSNNNTLTQSLHTPVGQTNHMSSCLQLLRPGVLFIWVERQGAAHAGYSDPRSNCLLYMASWYHPIRKSDCVTHRLHGWMRRALDTGACRCYSGISFCGLQRKIPHEQTNFEEKPLSSSETLPWMSTQAEQRSWILEKPRTFA